MHRCPADESGRGENICAKREKDRKHLLQSISEVSAYSADGAGLRPQYMIFTRARSEIPFCLQGICFLSLKRQTGEALVFAPVVA